MVGGGAENFETGEVHLKKMRKKGVSITQLGVFFFGVARVVTYMLALTAVGHFPCISSVYVYKELLALW